MSQALPWLHQATITTSTTTMAQPPDNSSRTIETQRQSLNHPNHNNWQPATSTPPLWHLQVALLHRTNDSHHHMEPCSSSALQQHGLNFWSVTDGVSFTNNDVSSATSHQSIPEGNHSITITSGSRLGGNINNAELSCRIRKLQRCALSLFLSRTGYSVWSNSLELAIPYGPTVLSFRGDCVSLSVVDLGRRLLEIADSLTSQESMLSIFEAHVGRERMHPRSCHPKCPLLSSAPVVWYTELAKQCSNC